MDPIYSLQDVIRCDHCEVPVPSKHCDICHIHLCDFCVEIHLSDMSIEHIVVPFSMRGCTPECQTHSTKLCKLHCQECDLPICADCITSGEHEQHNKVDILETVKIEKELKATQSPKSKIYLAVEETRKDQPNTAGKGQNILAPSCQQSDCSEISIIMEDPGKSVKKSLSSSSFEGECCEILYRVFCAVTVSYSIYIVLSIVLRIIHDVQ